MLTRENRFTLFLSVLSGAAGGALTMFLLSGTPVIAQEGMKSDAKVVAAEELRLVDKTGKVRGLLSFSAEGEPYLALMDGNDNQRVWLGVAANTGLAVKDGKEAKTRVLLAVDDTAGQPSLVLRSRQHQVVTVQPKEQ